MTTQERAIAAGQRAAALTDYPASSARFDWLMGLLSAWLIAGLYLDGWAHGTFRDEIETFFTPWHAVLYSGLLVSGMALVAQFIGNVRRGYHWTRALPRGYRLSLLGAAIFLASGLFDFGWHSLFGFEVDIEALLSPAHLALATGGVLLVEGPFRAAWLRPRAADKEGWIGLLPALLSLLAVYSVYTFFLASMNGFGYPHHFTGVAPVEDPFTWDIMLISFVLVPTGLMMSFILLALRRWRLPPGSLTLLITANAVMMYLLELGFNQGRYWPVVLAAPVGGIVADALMATLRPSAERLIALRVFTFTTPVALWLTYFLILQAIADIWWSIHLWLGVCFMAGITGVSLSYVYAPPPAPDG